MARGSKMSTLSTSGLSVELLLQVINVKYGCFALLLLLNSGSQDWFPTLVSFGFTSVPSQHKDLR